MVSAQPRPVIKAVRYFLAHTPGLVRHGSKPLRELAKAPGLVDEITGHLRSYQAAVAYPPNRVYLGSVYPDQLSDIERPWFLWKESQQRRQPHGEIMPEEELFGLLKIADVFDLVWLEEQFARESKAALAADELITGQELEPLDEGRAYSAIESQVADGVRALPLYLRNGRLIGCINRGHEEDASLTPARWPS